MAARLYSGQVGPARLSGAGAGEVIRLPAVSGTAIISAMDPDSGATFG